MANTYTLPAILPNPDEFAIGQDVLTAAGAGLDTLRDVLNQMLGHGQAGPLWCQSWPAGDLSHAGASLGNVCEWRIPHVSDSHTTITVGVACANAAGDATLTWTSSNTAATAVINTAAVGGVQYLTATLNIGAGVATSEVTLTIATAATTVTVYELFAFADPLASPLAAGTIGSQWGLDDGVPLGASAYGTADLPLSAARGRDMHQSLRHLLQRPQCLSGWSGVDNVTSATALASMDSQIYRGVYTPPDGGNWLSAGGSPVVRVEFHVRAIEQVASKTYVYCQLGEGSTATRNRIVIPIGTGAAAWHSLSITMPAARLFDAVSTPAMPFALWPDPYSGTPGRGRTDATVLSWTVIAR